MFDLNSVPNDLVEDHEKADFISKEIKKQYSELSKLAKTTAEHEIQIGQMFIALKQVVRKKGKTWNAHVEKKFPYMNIRTVQRWMKLAKAVDVESHPGLAYAGQTRLLTLANLAKREGSEIHAFLKDSEIDLDFNTKNRKEVGNFRDKIDALIKEQNPSPKKRAKTSANALINRLLKAAKELTRKLDDTVDGEEDTEAVDKKTLENSIEEVEELLEQLKKIKARLYGKRKK